MKKSVANGCAAALLSLVSIAAMAETPASIALPGDTAYPENITGTANGVLYVSNLSGGGILRIAPKKQPEVWIKPGDYGSGSTLGILADEARNLLWVCSNDMSMLGIASPGKEKGSALKAFDIKTGKGVVSAPFPATPSICNDIAIDSAGDVYVTNTMAPEVLKLSADRKSLTLWKTDPKLAPNGGGGLDGIAFGRDGHLYVNKIGSGELLRIDVKAGVAGAVTPLQPSRPLTMPDGLRLARDGSSFLMIEGGGSVDRVTIDGDTAKIVTIKDGYTVPTGVFEHGDTLWISEGQNGYLLDPALKGQKPTLPFHVYSLPAPKK